MTKALQDWPGARREIHRGDGPEPSTITPHDPRGDRDYAPPEPEADDGLDVVRERLERARNGR